MPVDRGVVEHPERLLERDPARLVRLGRPQPVDQRQQRASTLATFGELEPTAYGIDRVRELAARSTHLGERVEGLRRLAATVEHAERLGAPAQGGLVARSQVSCDRVLGERIGRPPGAQQRRAGARVRGRALGRDLGCLGIRRQRINEAALQRSDVSAPQRLLVTLVQRLAAHPRLRHAPDRSQAISSTSNAFCACNRFSDCSKMMLLGPSITSDVISSPR